MSYSHTALEINGDQEVAVKWYRCDLTGQLISEAWPHLAINGVHLSEAALQEVVVPHYFKTCPVPFEMIVGDIAERIGYKKPSSRDLRKAIPIAVRQEVLASNNGQCVACGSSDDIQVDHIRPVSRGGCNSRSNLQPMCSTCNLRKGNRLDG